MYSIALYVGIIQNDRTESTQTRVAVEVSFLFLKSISNRKFLISLKSIHLIKNFLSNPVSRQSMLSSTSQLAVIYKLLNEHRIRKTLNRDNNLV